MTNGGKSNGLPHKFVCGNGLVEGCDPECFVQAVSKRMTKRREELRLGRNDGARGVRR